MTDYVTVAVPSPLYWRTFDDGPSYSVVSLDWPTTLSIMRSTARKAYHTPIRWEVNPRFFMLMGRPDVFHDLPVVESEGSFCRLICRERTYELDLNA